MEEDEHQIGYVHEVDTEESYLYQEHFYSSLLAEMGNGRAAFQSIQNFSQNRDQYFSNKQKHVLTWKGLFL